jgi:polysaccharide pyruvyl transferase CsaB
VKIVVAGYYGEGNLGDDALLYGLLSGLGKRDIEPLVLSGNPDGTFRTFGTRSIPRRNFGAIGEELDSAAALVFGGGGLLQDATSLLSLKYYTHLIHLAKKRGKKVVLLAQGLGPIESFLGKRAASAALKMCDAITVRDAKSLALARSLGAGGRVELTADLAWLVKGVEGSEGTFQVGDMKAIAISARPWGKGRGVAEAFGEFTQILFKNGYVPVLIEMDRSMDTAVLDSIAKQHGGRCPDIRNVTHPGDMVGRISRMHGVVAMRLHAGIFAAAAGIAPLMVAYDPKVSSFAGLLGLPFVTFDSMTPSRLWDAFRSMEERREELDALTRERAAEQVTLANKNIDVLLQILGVS